MAIYHLHMQIITRGKGRSAVAAAAYQSGQTIKNEYDGVTHDYTHKGGIIHAEILLPANAPKEFSNRSTLWNAVEKIEKSSNAQLARGFDIALPIELTREQNIALAHEYVSRTFVEKGMCADLCVHDPDDETPNPHRGFSQYNKAMFLSTSINYESAAILYLSAMSILGEKNKEIEAILQCSNNTTLFFECKPDSNNQMTAHLVINKNNRTIPFRFSTHHFQVRENGRMVTNVIQSGLGVFAKVLDGYLSGIGADLHLSKLTEEVIDPEGTPPPTE